MNKKPLSIYIHIPFCVKKCLYCDFNSFPPAPGDMEAYIRCLRKEIKEAAGLFKNYYVNTVFLGGGTPSLLSAGDLAGIFEELYSSYDFSTDGLRPDERFSQVHNNKGETLNTVSPDYCKYIKKACTSATEITIEANPGTLNKDYLQECVTYGVNRISLGLQSADDRELKLIGRIHNYRDFEESFAACREAGIPNINVDLMSALPGQDAAGFEKSLRTVIKKGPEHISAYSLILEEGTPLYDIYTGTDPCVVGKYPNVTETDPNVVGTDPCVRWGNTLYPPLPTEDTDREIYYMTGDILKSIGYDHYEISNYARPGFECRHNVTYWTRGDYIGFGLGAASLINNRRFSNPSDFGEYLHVMGTDPDRFMGTDPHVSGTDPYATGTYATGTDPYVTETYVKGTDPYRFIERLNNTHRLTVKEQMEEFIFLGLRMTNGVSIKTFSDNFKEDIMCVYGDVINKYCAMGYLDIKDGRLFITPKGYFVSNTIMAEFLF